MANTDNTEQITDRIFRIKVTLPNNPLRSLNSYLVRGDGRNLLIDAGFNLDVCYGDLMGGLAYIGVDMADTDIFFTHFHSDHCGLACRIAHENSRIYMGRADMELNSRYLLGKEAEWGEIVRDFISAGYTAEEIIETRHVNPAFEFVADGYYETIPVDDGQAIDIGGVPMLALATPGHTPGHTCLYETGTQTLFAGDHILFDITPNITDWRELRDPLGSYMQNLGRIQRLPARRALVGHRENEGDFRKRVTEILAHHRDRLREALGIIEEEPGQTAYEIASRMTWSIRAKTWDGFPLAQKWFAVGEAMAHLKHLCTTGRVVREMKNGMYRHRLAAENLGAALLADFRGYKQKYSFRPPLTREPCGSII
jgi:glyoxylase-like metal-dependent hydrolase (beta-lactamase superfamily II)